ncbi:MAG: hypothetical protein AAB492_01090 [Patescibacteria group bacterium]
MNTLVEWWIQHQIDTESDKLRADEKAVEEVDKRTNKKRKGRVVVEYVSPGGNYPRPVRRTLCDSGVPLSTVLGSRGYFHEMVYKAVNVNPGKQDNKRILSLGAYVPPIQGEELQIRKVDRNVLRFTSG